MPAVKVRDGEPFERAYKRFVKACEKAGLMSDIKKHQHFEKPSEKKKRKLATAKRKSRRFQLENY
ncbi:30S ribosomal protein S21 [bacterium SM23_31]|nr:MAG: 30S ribosomal protein S21 [bacterium SM23_31]